MSNGDPQPFNDHYGTMHLNHDLHTEDTKRHLPDHIGHKITNDPNDVLREQVKQRDLEWALNVATNSDNIKPAPAPDYIAEVLEGVTLPENRIPRTLGDISREEFEELMGKNTASAIIDTAFEAAENRRRTFDGRIPLHLAPDQIVTLIRAEVDNDLPTYLLVLSNVIISLRVTVTHLVVTGGPPPAMCQAA
jgi:hypothetical protein